MKRIILISTSIVLILGAILVGAYVSSDKYSLEVYFRTPEDAINYIVENLDNEGNGTEENFKDALSDRAYYTNCIFKNWTYSSMISLKSKNYKLEKLEGEKFLNYHELIKSAIKKNGNRPYEIYYANLGEDSYYDGKVEKNRINQIMFLMTNNGKGWVLDTLSETNIPVE